MLLVNDANFWTGKHNVFSNKLQSGLASSQSQQTRLKGEQSYYSVIITNNYALLNSCICARGSGAIGYNLGDNWGSKEGV